MSFFSFRIGTQVVLERRNRAESIREKLKLWHSTKENLPVWVDSTAQHIHITSRLQLFAQQIIINVLDCVTPCLHKQYLTYWRRHRIEFVMIFRERKIENIYPIWSSWKLFFHSRDSWNINIYIRLLLQLLKSLTSSHWELFLWQSRRLHFIDKFDVWIFAIDMKSLNVPSKIFYFMAELSLLESSK